MIGKLWNGRMKEDNAQPWAQVIRPLSLPAEDMEKESENRIKQGLPRRSQQRDLTASLKSSQRKPLKGRGRGGESIKVKNLGAGIPIVEVQEEVEDIVDVSGVGPKKKGRPRKVPALDGEGGGRKPRIPGSRQGGCSRQSFSRLSKSRNARRKPGKKCVEGGNGPSQTQTGLVLSPYS